MEIGVYLCVSAILSFFFSQVAASGLQHACLNGPPGVDSAQTHACAIKQTCMSCFGLPDPSAHSAGGGEEGAGRGEGKEAAPVHTCIMG